MKKHKIKFYHLLNEQNLSGKKTKPLVDAITKRHPVTFYYTGPKTPEKESVKPGVRIRAEVVAMGLSKKGNLIIRAYVQPPSVSKKGFNKHGWRTFIVNRMSNINVLTDDTFDEKRPKYKEGEESKRGPMVVTYVTTNWDEIPQTPDPQEPTTEPTPEPKAEPTPEPEVPEKGDEELPQPKVDDKPSPLPDVEKVNYVGDVMNTIQSKIKDINGQKQITTSDYEEAKRNLYKKKESDWINKQKELGLNINPGEGTRKRFEVSSNLDLSNELKKNNIKVVDGSQEPLQENIQRIKSLMLQLK
jgi:hypothetical protein